MNEIKIVLTYQTGHKLIIPLDKINYVKLKRIKENFQNYINFEVYLNKN